MSDPLPFSQFFLLEAFLPGALHRKPASKIDSAQFKGLARSMLLAGSCIGRNKREGAIRLMIDQGYNQ